MLALTVQDVDTLPDNAVISRISDLALVLTADGHQLTYVNPPVCDYLGWSSHELYNFLPWQEKLTSAAARQSLADLCKPGSSFPAEAAPVGIQLLSAGGMQLSAEVHSVFRAPEHVLLILQHCVSTDSVEEILRQTNARFRSIIDSLSINLVLKDTDGRRIYANQSYLRLRGLELDDVLGKRDSDLFPEDIAQQFTDDDQHVLLTGKLIHKFEENVGSQGERRWTEIIKGPIRDADGIITGVQILFWDATERKHTELELERERYLLHALLDNIPDSIYFKDQDSRFLRISRGMAKKFNLASTQVAIGQTDADIFTQEHAEQALNDELKVMQSGMPMVAMVERETWSHREDTWCSTTKLPLRDASGKIIGTFGVSRDVTELMKIEQQLREARDQANSASLAKSDFLANMSHEIRTPMNGIMGMAELLSHTKLSDTQQSYLGMIEQSADALLRIINDILDFSKIEAGKLDIEAVAFDLPQAISQAAKGLAIRAAKKSVELKLELADDVPERIVGDAYRLRQVIVNLAGNSIKFTDKGSITIRVAVASGPPADQDYTLHFSVIDTGIGIPANKQSAIFEAFSQADVSTTRTHGGTGLGLSISSQLVDMMGGKIWLESQLGVGSTFHFNCRVGVAAKIQSAKLDDSAFQLHALRALVVGENSSASQTLADGLRGHGLDVTQTENHDQAIDDYKAFPNAPERCVLVVDQGIESQDSIQLIEQLQSIAPSKHPITILLSALPDPLTARSSEKLKSVVILQKPALHTEICDAIRRIASGEAQDKANAAQNDTPPPEPLRLLIAEDGEVNRAILLGLLAEAGHSTEWVDNGQAAVDAWRSGAFDAILMDIQMPDMDGLEATRLIRSEQQAGLPAGTAERIPIIAITAGAMSGDQTECFAAGMDDYLSKPIDFDALNRLLTRLRAHADNQDPKATFASEQEPASEPLDSPNAESAPEAALDFDAPVQKFRVTSEQQTRLVETLKKEINQRLEELSAAISAQDGKLLVRASHSLKSAAAMFDAKSVSHTSSTIENAARKGDFSVANTRFSELRKISTVMLREIDDWLETRSDSN